MERQRRQRRRAASIRSKVPGLSVVGIGGMARKARASARAARSEPEPEAMRIKSRRSPCSPVAPSVHLPGTPGVVRRTKSERPLAPRISPAVQYRPCRRPWGRYLRQTSSGAIAKSGGESGGRAHGTSQAIRKWLGRGTGIGSIRDLSRGCRERSDRGPSPPLGGAGSTAGARSARRAVRPVTARAGLQKERAGPVPVIGAGAALLKMLKIRRKRIRR